MKKLILKTCIVALVLFPFWGGAQTLNQNESLTITLAPENPKAGQEVSLRLSSRSRSLEEVLVAWSKNGEVERRGVGETEHSTKVGNTGKVETISASITTETGEVLSVSRTIRVAGVTLLWEADSYTPLFYKGKGLAAHQSEVRVIAIPSVLDSGSRRIAPKNIDYTWIVDGNNIKSQSGPGKNVLAFTGALVSRAKTVTVVARYVPEEIVARETIVVNFVEPELVVYKENPLTGLKNNTSVRTGIVPQGSEERFIVEPYYFSRKVVEAGVLNYGWNIDGLERPELGRSNEITFGGDVLGSSAVSVNVVNPLVLLQEASSFFRISIR